ncbi:MAG: ribosome maturation factor RimP [Elusimicrobiota bacterium]|jgi:ribosome maturation factor RimP
MTAAKSVIVEQIEQLSFPVLQEHGAELVDLQFVHEHGHWVLRFFLDKENGITLDDCAQLSNHLGRILDATDVIQQSYSLEVSSPGLYRPLRKESDFKRYIGQRVDARVFAPLNGRRHFRGIIESAENDTVIVRDSTGEVISLPLAGLAKANLDPEIEI